MTASVRDAEARAIAELIEMHLNGPDEWNPEHWDYAESLARTALPWVRRDGRTIERDHKPKASKTKRDHAALVRARPLVEMRSGGFCEASTDVCEINAVHVHHKAGRQGARAHELGNLLHVCDACHRWIHANPERSYAEGWLVKRLGAA